MAASTVRGRTRFDWNTPPAMMTNAAPSLVASLPMLTTASNRACTNRARAAVQAWLAAEALRPSRGGDSPMATGGDSPMSTGGDSPMATDIQTDVRCG